MVTCTAWPSPLKASYEYGGCKDSDQPGLKCLAPIGGYAEMICLRRCGGWKSLRLGAVNPAAGMLSVDEIRTGEIIVAAKRKVK